MSLRSCNAGMLKLISSFLRQDWLKCMDEFANTIELLDQVSEHLNPKATSQTTQAYTK